MTSKPTLIDKLGCAVIILNVNWWLGFYHGLTNSNNYKVWTPRSWS